MLHSASIIGRNVVLFGGSSNSIYLPSSKDPPKQCFENQLLIYNIGEYKNKIRKRGVI